MDDSLRSKAEQLASEMAGEAQTVDDLNGLMRLMMKSALERMLNTEMDVHLGRKTVSLGTDADSPISETPTASEPASPSNSHAVIRYADMASRPTGTSTNVVPGYCVGRWWKRPG